MATKENMNHNLQPESGEQAASNSEAAGKKVAGVATGPRTLQGKTRSRANALRHGILARAVVLPGESRRDFDAVLGGLRQSLNPVGALEDDLVETLAVTRWRQGRVLVAEGAEIQAGQIGIGCDRGQVATFQTPASVLEACGVGMITKISDPDILHGCLQVLKSIKAHVQKDGLNSTAAVSLLKTLYGEETFWRRSLFARHRLLSEIAVSANTVREIAGNPSPEQCRLLFLEDIDLEVARLSDYEAERLAVELQRLELEGARRSVPDSARLDHLLRYWSALERTWDRTLVQLERAQRMRLGQPSAPRIELNISSG